jgi:hypothetical protein
VFWRLFYLTLSYVKLWLPVGCVVCLPDTGKLPSPASSTGWSLYSHKRQYLLGIHQEQWEVQNMQYEQGDEKRSEDTTGDISHKGRIILKITWRNWDVARWAELTLVIVVHNEGFCEQGNAENSQLWHKLGRNMCLIKAHYIYGCCIKRSLCGFFQ